MPDIQKKLFLVNWWKWSNYCDAKKRCNYQVTIVVLVNLVVLVLISFSKVFIWLRSDWWWDSNIGLPNFCVPKMLRHFARVKRAENFLAKFFGRMLDRIWHDLNPVLVQFESFGDQLTDEFGQNHCSRIRWRKVVRKSTNNLKQCIIEK